MNRFALLAAIDLRGGKCVRLVRGDFARETAYGDDPVAVARRFEAEGADALHVVDLDGARAGRASQADLVRGILAAVRIPVQVGGGIRDEATAAAYLDAGAARVICGTRAVADPAWFAALCRARPGRVGIALDVKEGGLAVRAWQGAPVPADPAEAARAAAAAGAAVVVVTAVVRDGSLEGPDLALVGRVVAASGAPVIASGGVATPADVAAIARCRAAGAILGTALYAGKLALADARAALLAPPPGRG
ncbi:MAG: HisA/HisF-related TIM barrel protein [Planctomycetales bacterium]|nr:HisA/HisF-related TIM barrel protein [Planctomycetales bacterium]